MEGSKINYVDIFQEREQKRHQELHTKLLTKIIATRLEKKLDEQAGFRSKYDRSHTCHKPT